MITSLIYFIGLAAGIYQIFWCASTNPYLIGLTLAVAFLTGMRWGEIIEKLEHMHHLWKSPMGIGE